MRLRLLVVGLGISRGACQQPLPTPAAEYQSPESPLPIVRNHGFIFKTEPKFRAESFDIIRITDNKSQIAPGYLFLDPSPQGQGWGPQIYDTAGNLVWHGRAHRNTQDFHVCDFLGATGTHLCIHERSSPSFKYVRDAAYAKESRKYASKMYGYHANGHDFNMLPGGESFLQPVEVLRSMDLKQYIGRQGIVRDCCFQEVKVRTGHSVFDWCYLEHLPISETKLFINSTEANTTSHANHNPKSRKAGDGTLEHPWDFCHINSIDKMNGDYIVSARHLDQVIAVAGKHNKHGVSPGSTLWRLGGRSRDFRMDFTFSKQHHVRFLSRTASQTVISLFDNAWEGTNEPSANTSSGKIVSLDHGAMSAQLIHSYPHPDTMLSAARGSMQVLPNGNVLIGWGQIPDITEHDRSGTLLYHARFTTGVHNRSRDINLTDIEFSYRTFKYPWLGKPSWKPKLLAFSTPSNRFAVTAYVSWNGATEVERWRFIVITSSGGPRIQVGTFPKQGFETQVYLDNIDLSNVTYLTPMVIVEALNAKGQVLAAVKAPAIMSGGITIALLYLFFLVEGIDAVALLMWKNFGGWFPHSHHYEKMEPLAETSELEQLADGEGLKQDPQ